MHLSEIIFLDKIMLLSISVTNKNYIEIQTIFAVSLSTFLKVFS